MTTMSLGSQIKSIYPNLTKSEKKVADYILEHIDMIGMQTLAQMSKKAGVGEATIMRFIYKLGYENIAQFKVEVVRESIMNNKSHEDDKTAESYVKKICKLMSDSLQANSIEDIERVAKLIDEASHIYFFGNGTSGFAAEVAAYRFFRAGVSCEGITDVHMMAMKSALVKEDELVIAISQSGDNSDIIHAAKLVKKNKCPIVTITGRKLSSLSQYGNINLFHAPLSLNDDSYYGGTLGIIIQEFLLEIIFNAYSQNHVDRIDEIQRATTIATDLHHEGLKVRGEE